MEAEFSPNSSSNELLQRARNDHRDASEILRQYGTSAEKTLRELGGARISCLKDNFQGLLEAFDDWDSQTRIVALLLAKDHWPPLEQLTPICLRLACDDPVPAVRGVALDALIKYYGWIKDPLGILWEMMFCWQDAGAEKLVKAIKKSCLGHAKDVCHRREDWREMIGGLADQMLYNRGVAEAHLSDPNPDVQCVALGAMAQEWKATKTAAMIAEKLISQGIDETKQVIALMVIANYYEGTDDRRIGKFFATIVRDDARHLKLRRTAYLALYRVRGTRPRTLPNPKALLEKLEFPNEVDWSFVASFD
jgi:hypothetical protein